jgi:sugar/nucleoside kinase (ribokinase family)
VFAVEAVDTLGAGDSFHGGFALALAEGRDEVAAMRFRRRRGRRSNAPVSAVFRAPRSARRWKPAGEDTRLK